MTLYIHLLYCSVTDKFPIVKKNLTKLGKSREEIEDKLLEKIKDHQNKDRNRSKVGTVIEL